MDKFDGIKRAEVKLEQNAYDFKQKNKKKRRKNAFLWRYIVAALLVVTMVVISNYTDLTELFKQDYKTQYAQD